MSSARFPHSPSRRGFLATSGALAAGGLGWTPAAHAAYSHGTLPFFGYPTTPGYGYPNENSIAIAWNRAAADAIAATRTQATIAARVFSMTHEAIYNAWAAYDCKADFTLGALRKRPSWEGSSGVLAIAISSAAYDVLVDLFPLQVGLFRPLLDRALNLGAVWTSYGGAARNVGKAAAYYLLQARHGDGSNQLGDLAPGAYADYTGYAPVNSPDVIVDINRWQPLRVVDPVTGQTVVQRFLTPHWGRVRPFALSSGSMFRATMGHIAPSQAEMDQLIGFSAALDDRSKSLVDLFAANPGSVSPPGQWMQIAEQVSANDRNDLDRDVKLLFTTAQAVMDAGIAAWDTKRVYDSVRPITAIPYYYRDQVIQAWGGPNQGTQQILGQNWRPFQRATSPTPPFPEFPSGHSTFSAAASTAIASLRGDWVKITGTVPAGGITFETNVPATAVTYTFWRLSEAAASAGLSRRVGGIHFEQGDLNGRAMGQKVGNTVAGRAWRLFDCY